VNKDWGLEVVQDIWNEVKPDIAHAIPFDLDEAVLGVFHVGSHSHGTYIPPTDKYGIDDVDLMVVCAPPPKFKLGLKNWDHAEYKHGKWDVVLYDWQKWLHMLRKSNPNVVGTLWLMREHSWVNPKSEALKNLLVNRELLLSNQMYPAFIGYARGQMYKMTHHAHQGYMGEKRKALVEKFGYDVKNASHLIRLLRMACEAFESGRLHVYRDFDAHDLIAIKSGKWSLEQVTAEAETLFIRAERAFATSKLRKHPNEHYIQKLMVQGYLETWGGGADIGE